MWHWVGRGEQAGFLRIQRLGGTREAEMMFQGLCEPQRNSHEWGEGQGPRVWHMGERCLSDILRGCL